MLIFLHSLLAIFDVVLSPSRLVMMRHPTCIFILKSRTWSQHPPSFSLASTLSYTSLSLTFPTLYSTLMQSKANLNLNRLLLLDKQQRQPTKRYILELLRLSRISIYGPAWQSILGIKSSIKQTLC